MMRSCPHCGELMDHVRCSSCGKSAYSYSLNLTSWDNKQWPAGDEPKISHGELKALVAAENLSEAQENRVHFEIDRMDRKLNAILGFTDPAERLARYSSMSGTLKIAHVWLVTQARYGGRIKRQLGRNSAVAREQYRRKVQDLLITFPD